MSATSLESLELSMQGCRLDSEEPARDLLGKLRESGCGFRFGNYLARKIPNIKPFRSAGVEC